MPTNEPMKPLLIAGTGTDVGKTIVSAILVKLLGATYWKPISCGNWQERDSLCVNKLTGALSYPEAYHFSAPLSPHQAAALEGERIWLEKIKLPRLEAPLIIEGVGGVLVPLNEESLSIDLFAEWGISWILVSKTYLGSINHTLLTLEALKQRKVNLLGIIFNGPENPEGENWICNYARLPLLGKIHQEKEITAEVIQRYCSLWEKNPLWKTLFF
jgi:dethiobiotin synthetase